MTLARRVSQPSSRCQLVTAEAIAASKARTTAAGAVRHAARRPARITRPARIAAVCPAPADRPRLLRARRIAAADLPVEERPAPVERRVLDGGHPLEAVVVRVVEVLVGVRVVPIARAVEV